MLHITFDTGHIIEVVSFEFMQNNKVSIITPEGKHAMFEICMSIKNSKYASSTNTFVCSFDNVENIKNVGE